MVRQARSGEARLVVALHGAARLGMAGTVRQGRVWFGGVGLGEAGQVRQGLVRLGSVWQVMARQAWRGAARCGWARQGWVRQAWRTNRKEKDMDYRYKAGFSFKVNANVVGQTMEEIERENGEVTAKLLLDKSRPKKSPTHDLFEWDDKKAAEHYRMHTARCVINSLQIVCEEIRPEPIVAFVNVSESKKASYTNVLSAFTDEEKRENYIRRAKEELDSFIKKYKDIEELADILLDKYNKLKGA